jgi:hypothetical protein
MFRNKILVNKITLVTISALLSLTFLVSMNLNHQVHAADQFAAGCYTSTDIATPTSTTTTTTPSSSTGSTSGSSSTAPSIMFTKTACMGTKDTGGYPIDAGKYCYVSNTDATTGSTGTFTQTPCQAMTCESGEIAIAKYNADCNVSDPCSVSAVPDQSETCGSSCSSATSANAGTDLCNSIVTQYLDPIILFLGGGVGLVITIMIIVGAIQYITSGGDPNGVAAAKKRIANALIALLVFGLMYALLNFIVPGGLF